MKKLLLPLLLLMGLSTVATAQSVMPLPAFSSTYTSSAGSRGIWFDAPCDFIITAVQVPDESKHGKQAVAIFNMGPGPHTTSATPTALQRKFFTSGLSSANPVPCHVMFKTGDRVGLLGCCGDATTNRNSYGAGSFVSNVLGKNVTLGRLWQNFNLVSGGGLAGTINYATGSIGRVHVTVTPPKGLFAGFTADKTVGAGPFAVQFTDQTFTSDPGGVKTWAWDFNGDTKIDSTIQNPKFLYPSIMKTATYDVTLTVTDAAHPSSSVTKKAYITVDPPPVANFTATPTTGAAPMTVQFTDTSTAAGTWAWDFDNNSTVDSTIQNPKFIYGAPGFYSVKLTVTNNGGNDSKTVANMIFVMAPGTVRQTVPAGFMTTNGNSANSWPWNNTTAAGHRSMYVYDSPAIKSAGPILIQQLRWRAHANYSTWNGGTHPKVTITLSTCPVDYLVVSPTFANNHGVDKTTVFNGTATVTPSTHANGRYYVSMILATPFLYDPAKGDLVIDYMRSGPVSSPFGGAPCDTITTAPAKRIQTSGAQPALTGSVDNSALITEITWVPAKGLYPSFKADKTIGAGPLTVQFTDKTYTSDPGGVKTWAWDLNGDSKVDSTLQNPKFIYPSIAKMATYDVTLTVTDAATPAGKSKTEKAYITIDPPPVADFSAAPSMGPAPLMVTFTDASVGATSWAWDFNNDTVVDSTLQNPKFIYGKAGTYSVTLTASSIGGSDKVTKANLIQVIGSSSNTLSADILQYQFNEVRTNKVFNSASTTLCPATASARTATWQGDAGRPGFKGNESGCGCLAQNYASSTNEIDTGWKPDISGSYTIMYWMKHGTNTTSGSAYPFGDGTLYGRVGGGTTARYYQLYARAGTTSVLIQSNPPVTPVGKWFHVAVVVDDAAGKGTWYFNGVADTKVTTFTPNTMKYKSTSTNNFAVGNRYYGYSSSYVGTRYYAMDDFRFYSGARTATQIKADMLHEVATAGFYDKGCGGATIGANSAPVLGGTAPVFAPEISGPASKPGLLVVGTAAKSFMTIALPWDLGFMGFTGCSMHCDLVLNVPFSTDAGGAASINLPIPPIAVLEGAHLYAQGYMIGTGMVNTPGLDINIQK